jgi:hypothetical protein
MEMCCLERILTLSTQYKSLPPNIMAFEGDNLYVDRDLSRRLRSEVSGSEILFDTRCPQIHNGVLDAHFFGRAIYIVI